MQTATVNFAQLEHMMLQDHQETQRSAEDQRQLHFSKNISHQEEKISHMEDQKKNSFRSALWGFFVNMLSQAAMFIPKYGSLISNNISQLGNLLNTFKPKAEQAAIDVEESQLDATQEAQQQSISEEHLKAIAENRQEIRHHFKQGMEDMQAAQAAATRV